MGHGLALKEGVVFWERATLYRTEKDKLRTVSYISDPLFDISYLCDGCHTTAPNSWKFRPLH